MKSFKKIFGVVIAVAICLCMTVVSFAAGTEANDYTGDNSQADVNVTINGNVIHVYSVEIEFTSTPTFTYSTGSKWDPDNYQYKPNNDSATWTGSGAVKVTNHSDLPVKYTVTSENVVSTFGALAINVANGTGTLEKCTPATEKGTINATATYTVSGIPTVSEISGQKLGEIHVVVEKTAE